MTIGLKVGFGYEVAVLGAKAEMGVNASEANDPEADVLEAEACPLTSIPPSEMWQLNAAGSEWKTVAHILQGAPG